MKVALVYDRVNKWGGAERVLLTLHEMFPDAPLYTSVYDANNAKWAKIFPKIIPSSLNKLAYLRNKHEYLGSFMPLVFESFDFSEFDTVISVTSEAAKGIITKPVTRHICYCLTPTRYLWNSYEDYFKNKVIKLLSKPVVSYLRAWDKIAAQRPNRMVSISSVVRKRIKKYYGLDSEVVFPPVDIKKFQTSYSRIQKKIEIQNKYYLVVSRLVSYKKVDLVVKAFNLLGLPLIIVGKGSEERSLKKIAKGNIKFINYLTDANLSYYYQNAVALIMPQEEDFGIVAVEAQAAGCPVIAYKKGGALDTIEENKTGIFFTDQNEKSLVDAIKRFDRINFRRQDLISNALKFSKENFKTAFFKLLK
jgi:glycosyltransferase involved in cell wall biosynthesis